MKLPLHQESYWLQGKPTSTFPSLNVELEVDVAIIGGGIAGLSVAYLLKQAGFKVAVIEKHTIASGTTGGNTAKVTAQHGLIYNQLMKQFGKANTRLYADAYKLALTEIEALIKREQIDCDWWHEDNFVYTTEVRQLKSFQEEAKVAAKLGLPASFETKLGLPLPVKGAVKFAHQARFNSVKYTHGLAQLVQGGGSFVFENSNVTKIREGKPCTVATKTGTITATSVVVATKIPPAPLAARLSYASIVYPETSYIVAGKTTLNLKGMYISPDSNHYSILPTQEEGERYILIGGEKHIPGLGSPTRRHQKLAQYAREHFGVEEIEYRWKAMDYLAYDKLPVVGKLYPWSKQLYVVTGFKKWGLSTSMVAAKIIRDLLQGESPPEAKLFYPHRASAPLAIPKATLDYLKS